MACSIEGLIGEIMHGMPHLDPTMICQYDVDVERIIDLSTEPVRAAENVSLDDMACGWLVDVQNNKRPASWGVAEAMIAKGAAGILAPSFASSAKPGWVNLVLYDWDNPPQSVKVLDPNNRLRRDRSSWA